MRIPKGLSPPEAEAPLDSFPAALRIQEGETIYSYSWYPGMTALDPAACCFASSSRVSCVRVCGVRRLAHWCEGEQGIGSEGKMYQDNASQRITSLLVRICLCRLTLYTYGTLVVVI